ALGRSFAGRVGGERHLRSGWGAGNGSRHGARDARQARRAVVGEVAGRLTSAAGSMQRGAGKGRPVTEWDAQAYHRVSALQQWLAEKSLHRVPLDGDERVLELCCGDGKITVEIPPRAARCAVVAECASH